MTLVQVHRIQLHDMSPSMVAAVKAAEALGKNVVLILDPPGGTKESSTRFVRVMAEDK